MALWLAVIASLVFPRAFVNVSQTLGGFDIGRIQLQDILEQVDGVLWPAGSV